MNPNSQWAFIVCRKLLWVFFFFKIPIANIMNQFEFRTHGQHKHKMVQCGYRNWDFLKKKKNSLITALVFIMHRKTRLRIKPQFDQQICMSSDIYEWYGLLALRWHDMQMIYYLCSGVGAIVTNVNIWSPAVNAPKPCRMNCLRWYLPYSPEMNIKYR